MIWEEESFQNFILYNDLLVKKKNSINVKGVECYNTQLLLMGSII